MPLSYFLNKAKDAALPLFAKWIANKYQLAQLGNMTTLKLDSQKQEIFVELDLKGETSPIQLTLQYEVLGPGRIEIKQVRSSREWIATFINDLVPGDKKQLDVPSYVTVALSQL